MGENVHGRVVQVNGAALRARSLSPEVRARVMDGARRKAMYVDDGLFVSSPLCLDDAALDCLPLTI